METVLENKDICKKCGGVCCKKSGCDYHPGDFKSLNFKDLYEKLEEGNISIVSTLIFNKLKDGKTVVTPFLYLRARNTNRDVVDLLSFKTKCSMLKEDGCSYDLENRPSGGVNLIPDENFNCKTMNDPNMMMKKWESYQRVLEKLVKKFTGYNVDERLRMDTEALFDDVFNENFEGVNDIELNDVRNLIPYLGKAFPEEFTKSLKKYQNNKQVKVLS